MVWCMYALKEDLITAKHYDKQFKIDAVQYYHDHKELGLIGCAWECETFSVNNVLEGLLW